MCPVQLEAQFKVMWANHGDDISLQYAGTGALKSGFTRTGVRTRAGLLDDGVKSGMRYYLNNFQDGHKQDALDLATGAYVVSKGEPPVLPAPQSALHTCCAKTPCGPLNSIGLAYLLRKDSMWSPQLNRPCIPAAQGLHVVPSTQSALHTCCAETPCGPLNSIGLAYMLRRDSCGPVPLIG